MKPKLNVIGIEEPHDIFEGFDQVRLRVILPTLNRPDKVLKNIEWNLHIWQLLGEPFKLQIIVSENAPDESISESVLASMVKQIGRSTELYHLKLHKRLGLGQHMRFLSGLSGADWHIWCGDDDLIDPRYFNAVVDRIKKGTSHRAFIPSNHKRINSSAFNHAELSDNIDWSMPSSIVKRIGSKDAWRSIYRGHQLSGIVIHESIETRSNAMVPESNLYPWMTYISIALQDASLEEFIGVPTKVVNDTPKMFSYGKDALFPDISEAVRSGFVKTSDGIHYAAKILSSKNGNWRIVRTSQSGIKAFINFISLRRNERLAKAVFIRIFFPVLYRCICYQSKQLRRSMKKTFSKNKEVRRA